MGGFGGTGYDIGTVVLSYAPRVRGHTRSCHAEGRMKKLTIILLLISSMAGAASSRRFQGLYRAHEWI